DVRHGAAARRRPPSTPQEPAVRAYRYLEEGTSRVAFTRDAGGRRLPVMGAVWLFAGAVELEGGAPATATPATRGRAVADAASIMGEILRKGYFLWPDDAAPARAAAG